MTKYDVALNSRIGNDKLEDAEKAFDILSRGEDETGSLVLKVMVGSGVAC